MNVQTVVPLLVLLALIPALLYSAGSEILGSGLSLLNILIISACLYGMVASNGSSR